ncbi:hypothetical protein U0C82_08095 [Fulvimarina sp. 2208YS6-2-32]|uniref:Uncharacterized protein n=1 Tax=Fulvimarina uroteuthidis TaxID=3098149 RepID=A0ABU5I1Y1_9HYPH|nr:hypothetical protein [Fulvimarina sp. 2208YS6-2-32]MDY8109105.1 hypothetical protein [Fulvimarina sp. 2208YS6-2-32]
MVERRLISDRLMDLLLAEVRTIEAAYEENKPSTRAEDRMIALPSKESLAVAKDRIDRIGLVARTLERLMEVRRAEIAGAEREGGDDAETVRLRDELLRRLKILDQRRQAAAGTPERQPGRRQAQLEKTDRAMARTKPEDGRSRRTAAAGGQP